jgi:replicative DNA helicase
MQAIARETDCHVMMVQQQLLKVVEKREDKQPTREGIKGSGEWTGVADTILGVYRADLYKPVPPGTIDVLLLKQRRGRWPFVVEFDFDPEFGTLTKGREVNYDAPGTSPEESKNTLDQAFARVKKTTAQKRGKK